MKRAKTARRMLMTKSSAVKAGESGVQTIIVPVVAPRNPFVSLAKSRKAGAHGGSGRSRRQTEKRELRAKLLEE